MTTDAVLRVRALTTLTGVLRGDATTELPVDSDGWAALLELASTHGLLPAFWVALRDANRIVMPEAVAVALERAAPPGRAVPEVVIRRAYDANADRWSGCATPGSTCWNGSSPPESRPSR